VEDDPTQEVMCNREAYKIERVLPSQTKKEQKEEKVIYIQAFSRNRR
jgi:hypothetical protein